MMKRNCAAAALLVALMMGWAGAAISQDASKQASATNNPQTAIEVQAAIAAQDPELELRYQFMSHAFSVGGTLQEIYLKLDSYTGKVWRFHASSGKWQPIAEPTSGFRLEPETYTRYELLSHDYFDTYGEDQELILRVDMVNGNTWTYRGANGTWKDVPTEN